MITNLRPYDLLTVVQVCTQVDADLMISEMNDFYVDQNRRLSVKLVSCYCGSTFVSPELLGGGCVRPSGYRA